MVVWRYALSRSGMPSEAADRRFVNDLIEDRQGSLWLGALGGLYRRWPDGRTRRYTTRDGLPDDNIHDLLEDHQGQLWAGTRYGGFFRFTADETPGTPFVAESYRYRDGLQSDWIFQLYETADHRFWVATNRGIVEFLPHGDSQGRRFHGYTPENGLSYHEISALGEDTGGNLWLGTQPAGAMKLARGGFITYDERDGLMDVAAIFEDAVGRVYFKGNVIGKKGPGVFDGPKLDQLRAGAKTYYLGFGRFDDGRFNWFRPAVPLNFGWVTHSAPVQTRDREWWVSSGEGLYRFPASDSFSQVKTARPLAVYLTKDGLAHPQVWQAFCRLWRQPLGLDYLTESNPMGSWELTFRDLANSPGLPSLKDELPRSFGEDAAGNVWVGLNTGVARHRDGSFHFFTARDGLPPGAIMSIHSDRAGRLWLASSRGGLVRVDDPASERPAFTSYTTAQGLSSNSTEAITEDLQGHIYVGTGRGLDQLDPATGRIKHFTTADGLAVGRIAAAFCDRSGVLWFGNHGGLMHFVPSSAEAAPPPPILLTGLRVAGEQRVVSAIGETEIALADLESDRNQLQIDFVALGFAPGERLRYQYRLEGSGADWSAPTEHRTVNFASLASGSYRFMVRAVNSDGVFSTQPASITFTVLRPFWLRWWFLSLAALALVGLAYAAYRFRVARLLEVADMRTRIATDLHDDIGTNLTKIAILSEVARQQLGNGDAGEDGLLSSIARVSRESVASMGDIVWAINPQRDSLLDLVRRMRRHAEDLFTSRDIRLEFDAPGVGEHLKLGAEVRRDLFLIFKEATGNAARHSDCSRVSVSLQPEGAWLVLQVVDDGVGFDPAAASEGQGLMSMRRRAHGLAGTFEIEAGDHRGTTLRVRVPCVRRRSAHFR